MRMDNVFYKSDDFLCRIQSIHCCLRNVGDLIAQNIFPDIIRFHSGNFSSIYDNIAADVVKRCEIIAHQGQRQRRFTTAGLTCYTEGFSLLNLQGDSVYGVYIFMKTSHIFRFQIVYFQHYFSHSCLLSLLTAG